MTDPETWSRAADAHRRIGRAIEHHAVLGSTSDRARALLSSPGGEGVAVVADLQTDGRGRHGRRWLSPPGANLMMSVGLRPTLAASRAWWLGAAAALAVRDAAAPWAALQVKWPNDLLGPDERKVAGLLLETAIEGDRVQQAVIGIGINVNWRRAEMPAEIADGATSLAELAGVEIDLVALLDRLLSALDREVARAEAGTSPLERYRAVSVLDGRQVRLSVDGDELAGLAAGIGEDGSLLLDTAQGRVAVAHGEVIRVRAADAADAVPA
ncbi:MAG: biotin--[acetyl-CoA-carboxylase] ligase [Candidatus Limnocylindria bacterium]